MTPFPPKTRSRAADGMDAAARRGRFELQVCDRCESVQYPCRDACRACLSESLTWRSVPAEGELLARTLIRSSAEPFFQTRLPIAIGLVQMARGPQVVSFLDAGIDAGDRVSLRLEIDPAGRALVHATRIDPA